MIRNTRRVFSPPTDLIELDDKLVVMMEIAGMRAEDFEINLSGRLLCIVGVRQPPNFHQPAFHQLEIGYGDFRIEVPVPYSVEQEKVSATYQDGFLHIELPLRAETRVRIIDLSTEGHQDEE